MGFRLPLRSTYVQRDLSGPVGGADSRPYDPWVCL